MKNTLIISILSSKKFILLMLIGVFTLINSFLGEQLIYKRHASTIQILSKAYTSNFTHWDNSHLLWNMVALFIIGIILIEENQKDFWLGVIISPIIVGIIIHFHSPITSYAGFSGVIFTLLTLACWNLILTKNKINIVLGLVAFIFAILKIYWEMTSHSAIFANNNSFQVTPEAHIAGVLAGIIIILYLSLRFQPFEV